MTSIDYFPEPTNEDPMYVFAKDMKEPMIKMLVLDPEWEYLLNMIIDLGRFSPEQLGWVEKYQAHKRYKFAKINTN